MYQQQYEALAAVARSYVNDNEKLKHENAELRKQLEITVNTGRQLTDEIGKIGWENTQFKKQIEELNKENSVREIIYREALTKLVEQERQLANVTTLPFVAMINKTTNKGIFDKSRQQQSFNGRYCIVYEDKNAWGCPLVQICGRIVYDKAEALAALEALKAGAHETK